MARKSNITPEIRELINEVAAATASRAYIDNAGGGINYFAAMESLLYNYKKLAALVADEEAYIEVEYHEKSKSIVAFHGTTSGGERITSEADALEEIKRQRAISFQRTKARFSEVDRVIKQFRKRREFLVVQLYYFNENADGSERDENTRYTFEEISIELGALGLARDEKTARRWRNRIVNDMAVCMFGKPAAVGAGTHRKDGAK